jgi:hypothetical protein
MLASQPIAKREVRGGESGEGTRGPHGDSNVQKTNTERILVALVKAHP